MHSVHRGTFCNVTDFIVFIHVIVTVWDLIRVKFTWKVMFIDCVFDRGFGMCWLCIIGKDHITVVWINAGINDTNRHSFSFVAVVTLCVPRFGHFFALVHVGVYFWWFIFVYDLYGFDIWHVFNLL